jgi:hypothetical protein
MASIQPDPSGISTSPSARSHRLIHDGSHVIALEESEGLTQTIHTLFTGTLAECQYEAARLRLDCSDVLQASSPIPAYLSRARFVIAARKRLGLTEGAIFALISQIPDAEQQEDARDLWENAIEFRRTNPFIIALASMQGLTLEQVDDFFRYAQSLDLD